MEKGHKQRDSNTRFLNEQKSLGCPNPQVKFGIKEIPDEAVRTIQAIVLIV